MVQLLQEKVQLPEQAWGKVRPTPGAVWVGPPGTALGLPALGLPALGASLPPACWEGVYG